MSSCCKLCILIFLLGLGPTLAIITQLTLTVPSEAYPGDVINLNCESSTPGLKYRWIDSVTMDSLSESQQFNLTLPLSTDVTSRMFTCQVSATLNGTIIANETSKVDIAFVNSFTFDIRYQDAVTKDKITIQCFASTTVSRTPVLSWFFNSVADRVQIDVTSTGYQIVDRTLTILGTDPVRSGVYECSATLDDVASTTKSSSTTIQIYSPPVVSLELPSNDVFSPLQYSLFQITCDVTGLETPTIEWLVNGLPPDLTLVDISYNITQAVTNSQNVYTSVSEIHSILSIMSVLTPWTSVSCLATTTLSSDAEERDVRVQLVGIPCPPVGLMEVECGSYCSEIIWSIDTECEARFLFASSYILEYVTGGNNRKFEYLLGPYETGNTEYSYIFPDLKPNTAYQIRVSAKNEYGTSEYTEYISVVTSPVDKKVIFYYGTENGDSVMEHGYNTQSPALKTAASIPVGNSRIESVYVSPFGVLSLDKRSYSRDPQIFGPNSCIKHLYLLAPFWSDIDYREEGTISYRVYQSGSDPIHNSVIEDATQLSITHAGADTTFRALAVIVATWAQVVPSGHEKMDANTFQAAIVTDYETTFVLFGYKCGELSWSSSATYPTSPVIGFGAGGILSSNHHLSYSKKSHNIGCYLQETNDSTVPVIVGYKISLSTADLNDKCIVWLSDDIKMSSGLPALSFGADACPCVLFHARRDSTYRFDYVANDSGIYYPDVICYVSRFSTNGLYQRCCYDGNPNSVFSAFLSSPELTPIINSGKQRGSILSTDPVYYPDELYQLYRERDEEGYKQCCLLSDKCDVFYRRRPSQDCTGYVPRPFTWGFGDPHVISIDGFMYTFNGIGEYWYLFPVGQCDFEVQARTQPFKDLEATVFNSMAVRIKNCSTVFVSLLGREDLSLFVDQQNRTDDIHSSGVISNDCVHIEYTGGNITQKSKIDVTYRNGEFLSLEADNELLSILISLPNSCKGRTSGLIGQWDDDVSNDLLMRNGTLLSQNVTDREKEEFADSWKITQEESLMIYETGDYSTYNPNYTLSLYLDEFLQNANIITEVIVLCDGNKACLFDAAVTNDTSIAAGSLLVTNEAEEVETVGNNVPPLIQTPLVLLLSLDNLTTLEFNVTDEDTFSVSYSLSPLSVFSQVQLHSLTLSLYQLELMLIEIPDSMNVTIIANDSIAVSVVSVVVFVCGCENGGYCSDTPSATDGVGDSGYIRLSCQCPLGYEGVYCSDLVTDPCLQSVCGVESCPSGTEKNEFSKCEDIDECILLSSPPHQNCTNTYGSYLRTCELGYQLVGEECIDVDECALPISPCQHNCTNNDGSFACSCDTDYVLEVDQSTCRGISNTVVCGTNPLYNCEDDSCIYVEGNKVCSYCKKGTELSSNGRFCEDIHECILQPDICPVVSSRCYDMFSTYDCLCNPGYIEDSYSENNCVDVNECENVSLCDSSQICFNTEGSFICAAYCYPPKNYILPSGDCAAADDIITRTPDSSETLTITFNLNFEELEQNLYARGLDLPSLYSALNDSLHTPLQDIQFSRYVTTDGKLELVLLSDSFQVDPGILTGTLRTSLLCKWAPYVPYVTQVSANDVSTVQPTPRLPLSTLLIIAFCGGSFLVLLLLGLSCVWAFSAKRFSCPTYGWKEKEDSIQEELLGELKKLKEKRAIGSRTVDPSKTDFPNWPRGIIKSNPLTCYPLSYMLSEDPPLKLYEEFDGIPMHLATVEDIPPACEDKNRFRNILPPPHSRVPLFLKYGLPNSDYINANFIRGYNMVPRMYIATQAPMFSTEQDFWRMVWEQKVKIIIVLTEMVERSREKCVPYWPDKDILTSIRFEDIEIISKNKIVREDYQINEFILKHLYVNEVQEVTHYWYRKWPEYGVPTNPNSLVTLLLETRGDSRTSSHPVLVHCASGTGRTGVVLAVDIGMHELEEKRSVDILRTVSVLRQDRGGLIQTREQYHFLYKTLCAYARYIDTRGGEKDVL